MLRFQTNKHDDDKKALFAKLFRPDGKQLMNSIVRGSVTKTFNWNFNTVV